MGDAPVRGHGEQALGKAVVERQRRLEPAHGLDLAHALAGDVGHLPQGQPLSLQAGARGGEERPHADAQPAAGVSAAGARADVELLVADFGPLGRAVEPEEGLRRIGLASEQLLQRRMPPGAPAGEALQGAVAVEHDALLVDDLEPVVEAVGDGLHHLGFSHALAQAQVARQQAQDKKGARHRQERQQGKHDRLTQAARQHRDENEAADGDKTQKE